MSQGAQAAWADAVIAGVVAAGVRTLITSPGSRSTPLLLAAARAGVLGASIIDERAAGFYALGRARVSGEPIGLLCTSGTAGAHYLPAVIEASEAGLPLVAITADRPPELHGGAAPQTIDQTRLFGAFARMSIDLGPPRAGDLALRAAARRAAQAVAASLDPTPGPVHINAPADEPLAPARPSAELVAPAGAAPRPPSPRPALRAPDPAAIAEVADACRQARRGLIVAGPAAPHADHAGAARELAEASGFPLLVEAASQLRFLGAQAPPLACDAFDLSLSSSAVRRRAMPELVIQLGRPPTSAALRQLWAEAPDIPRVILSGDGWPDPDSSASALIRGDVAASASALAAELRADPGEVDPGFAEFLARADAIAWRCVEAELAGAVPLTEGAAVRAAVAAMPEDSLLCVGNSLPIRTVDRYCPARLARVAVASQRGANGIDGLISGAAGSAAARGVPTLALIGDVSFAHDVGGLAAASSVRSPLAIVVLDNGGGRIFDQLPIGAHGHEAWYAEHFRTAPPAAPELVAQAFGIRGRVCDDAADLRAAAFAALAEEGCTVIRARVDPGSAQASLARLREAVDKAAREELS